MLILVLGCHRSGTSALTGALHQCGASLGRGALLSPEPENSKGYFESEKIVRLNDNLLKALGHKTHYPEYLPPNWKSTDLARDTEHKISEVLIDDFDLAEVSVIKDPRIVILWPLYLRLLNSLDINFGVVRINRDLNAVVDSLIKWRGLSEKDASNMVDFYKRALGEVFYYAVSDVSYEGLIADPTTTIKKISRDLGIELDIQEEKLKEFLTRRP